MVKVGKWIAKHKVLVLLIGLLLVIPSVIGIAETRVNYDLLSYLPDTLETVKGQDILVDEFGMGAFSMVIVENMDMKDVQKLEEKFSEVEHVKDVLWYDDVADISLPVEMIPQDLREAFFKGDATMMLVLVVELLGKLGLENLSVRINSIGCPNCRPAYQQHFKEYLNARREKLCKSCQERMDINPMRTLDCKEAACKEELKDAPVMMDHLCDECRAHFEALKGYLEAAGIRYTVDPRIVRGLDYYTKTVFEIITDTPNGELTVCGGGRYDGLVEEIGGPSIPAVGFGMGIERVLMLLDQQNSQKLAVEDERPQVFVTCLNQSLSKNAFLLMEQFRRAGLRADMDHQGRSLKAQFKYADKLGAQYVAVLGDDEVAKGVVKLRNMQTRDEWESPLKTAPEDLKAHLEK